MDEFARIARYLAPLATGEGAFGLGNDAAVLEGGPFAITKDCLIAGVHFIGDEAPALLAQKALAVNLSDLAAMGARPTGYLLGLMLPRKTDEAWFASFAQGLAIMQDRFGIVLLGGDTTATPGPLSLSVTALGMLAGPALGRDGAQAGDGIYVTGTLGDAALGLDVLRGLYPPDAHLIARYRLPEPRVALGQRLIGIASVCMDISDGLLQDMGHIARASGLKAHLSAPLLPLSSPARALCDAHAEAFARIATGGDDYELLFTAPDAHADRLAHLATETGIAITRIGRMEAGNGVVLRDAQSRALDFAQQGYTHF